VIAHVEGLAIIAAALAVLLAMTLRWLVRVGRNSE
jgi:hypothetical protein